MNSYLIAAGIRFNDYFFTEPRQLAEWAAPRYAGLFVILVRDSNWAPKSFQPLFFGEFGNNTEQIVLPGDIRRLAGTLAGAGLFIATLPMPFSTTAARSAVRDELVWAYNPRYQMERG